MSTLLTSRLPLHTNTKQRCQTKFYSTHFGHEVKPSSSLSCSPTINIMPRGGTKTHEKDHAHFRWSGSIATDRLMLVLATMMSRANRASPQSVGFNRESAVAAKSRTTPRYWSPPIILISAALVHGRLLASDVATSLRYRPCRPRLCTAIFSSTVASQDPLSQGVASHLSLSRLT